MALTVATLTNRDPEQMDQLRGYFRSTMAIETVDFEPGAGFNERQFQAALERRQIKLILAKWTNAKYNAKFVRKLRKLKCTFVNSLEGIQTCQSRRAMFRRFTKRLPYLHVPKVYKRLKQVKRALNNGTPVLARRDAHHIPKEERVLGVLRTIDDLRDLLRRHLFQDLFFQEYLGIKTKTYKVYVVDRTVECLVKTGTQDGVGSEDHVEKDRVTLPFHVKTLMRDIGRAFGLRLYGVDFFYHEGVLVVIDVNDFPSYNGIDEAPRLIGDFLSQSLARE